MPYSGPFGRDRTPAFYITGPDTRQNYSMRLVEGTARPDDVIRWFREDSEAKVLKLRFNLDSGAFHFSKRDLRNLTDLLTSNGLPFRLKPKKDYFW